jgi:hypothetical protein
MRKFDPGRAQPAPGFGDSANFPAFYHREAAKKNGKLPAHGAQYSIRVRAKAVLTGKNVIYDCVYGKILRAGTIVPAAG